jgi:hypothetical protein
MTTFGLGDRRLDVLGLDDLGEAEVGDLRDARARQDDVLGLDVAVDDAARVGVLERVAELRHDASACSGGASSGRAGRAGSRPSAYSITMK